MHSHRFLRRLNQLHQVNSLTKIPRNLAISSLKPANGGALVRQCMVHHQVVPHHQDMEDLRLHLLDLVDLHLLDSADLCLQCHTCHRCPRLLIGDIHLLRRRPRRHLRRLRLLLRSHRSHLLRFRLRRCHRPLLLVLKDLLELLVSLAPSVLSGLSEQLVLQAL